MRRLLTTIVPLALVVGACGGDATPDEVLTDHAEALNSGDVDAAMALYADDAVVIDHPFDFDGMANGVEEIRVLEAQVPAALGSGDGIEYTDMEVSGNTVTFNHRFHYGSDGIASGGTAGCLGGTGDTATIEDGKITLVDWGPFASCG